MFHLVQLAKDRNLKLMLGFLVLGLEMAAFTCHLVLEPFHLDFFTSTFNYGEPRPSAGTYKIIFQSYYKKNLFLISSHFFILFKFSGKTHYRTFFVIVLIKFFSIFVKKSCQKSEVYILKFF